MQSNFSIVLFLSLPFLLLIGAADEDAIAKKIAADDFRKNIVATEITSPDQLGWTGKEKSCKPGNVSRDTYVKMLARINYFRRLAGVADNIVLDSSWNKYAQAAAQIMYANKALNHFPDPSMKCYSADGKTGSSTSNLTLFTGSAIKEMIIDQIEDGSTSNIDCGHRRWLLYSKAYKMGFGATPESYAVRDFASPEEMKKDTSSFHGKIPEYFAYPFKGFVPYQVVYPKWSFSIPGIADFSKAIVETKIGEKLIACTIISRGKMNFGDPTLVWTVKGLKENFDYHFFDMTEKRTAFVDLGWLNKKVTVKISNVKVDGKMKSYSYSFTVFDPDEFN